MKRLIGIITMEVYVPEDMDPHAIEEIFQLSAEQNFESLRIHLPDYHDQAQAEPLFEFESATVAESVTIAYGK